MYLTLEVTKDDVEIDVSFNFKSEEGLVMFDQLSVAKLGRQLLFNQFTIELDVDKLCKNTCIDLFCFLDLCIL